MDCSVTVHNLPEYMLNFLAMSAMYRTHTLHCVFFFANRHFLLFVLLYSYFLSSLWFPSGTLLHTLEGLPGFDVRPVRSF